MSARPLALLLAGALAFLPAAAGDYDQVLATVKQVWPEKRTGAAVCSVDFNQMALLDLTDGAKDRGISLLILNVKAPKELEPILNMLLGRKPDFVVLIEGDPSLGEKNRAMQMVVGRARVRRIPTVGISEDAIKYGAIFAIGDATGGKLLVNGKVAKEYGITIPEGAIVK